MKDSGVEWIGQIPNLWSSIRIKNIIAQRDAGAWGELEQGNNNDVICIRVADFDYSHFTIQNNKDYTLRNYSDFQIKSIIYKIILMIFEPLNYIGDVMKKVLKEFNPKEKDEQIGEKKEKNKIFKKS